MSIRMSDPRRARAGRALSDLGDARSEHEVLSVQCHRSHHVATVYETPAGLVFRSVNGPHAHGRMDRPDVAHGGHAHGVEYVEILDSDQADDRLPASCDCGAWSLSRTDLLADVRAGIRTTRAG